MLVEVISGAWGGRPDRDGVDGVTNILINQQNTPVELLELEYPVRITEYGLVPGSGGAGRFRGGDGMVREIEFLGHEAILSLRSDRRRFVPYGLFGGHPGTPSEVHHVRKGVPTLLPTKSTTQIEHGDRVRFQIPGAGGYGDPRDRAPQAVLDDFLNGVVSLNQAADLYGVVINNETLKVDPDGTALLRSTGSSGSAV